MTNENPSPSTQQQQPKPEPKPSSLDSYRDKLTGQIHVSTPEDTAAFKKHCAEIVGDLAPFGPRERQLAQAVAEDMWRLQRARAQEKRYITVSMECMSPYDPRELDPITRYMTHAERGWHRAITQFRSVQNDQTLLQRRANEVMMQRLETDFRIFEEELRSEKR